MKFKSMYRDIDFEDDGTDLLSQCKNHRLRAVYEFNKPTKRKHWFTTNWIKR